jgi:predicted pyridoxine 5'-phosphate oxidase superfamily flavin-nucleotide-binding protein
MKMEKGLLDKVRKLVRGVKVVYVATANREGAPHIAASEGMTFVDGDRIVFRAWFCIKTVGNLRENPRLSLAVLNTETGEGYQLLGELERIERGAMLNGFAFEKEGEWAGYPQAEHQLHIRITAISHLTSGAHSDEVIERGEK